MLLPFNDILILVLVLALLLDYLNYLSFFILPFLNKIKNYGNKLFLNSCIKLY